MWVFNDDIGKKFFGNAINPRGRKCYQNPSSQTRKNGRCDVEICNMKGNEIFISKRYLENTFKENN